MSFLELLRPNKRTLVDIVLRLPKLGVGQRVTHPTWAPFGDSYYEITRVRAKQDGKSARIWGLKVLKGVPDADGPQRIPSRAKSQWLWQPEAQKRERYTSISKRLEALNRPPAGGAAAEGAEGAAPASAATSSQ